MPDIAESHRDLLQVPVATLVTLGHDGYPQVSLTWFLFDDDGFLKLSINSTRQKARNLARRPECTLLIVDPESDYRYLEIRANATVEPDDDYVLAGRVGQKYGGTDLRTRDEPGETRVAVTLDPVRVRAIAIG